MPGKALVADANMLIRAAPRNKARALIELHGKNASFFVPEPAYREAEEHLSARMIKRGGDPAKALTLLRAMRSLVDLANAGVYGGFGSDARERLGARDPEDQPVSAAALAIGCAISSEDTDFFGCGVATWSSGRVEMFLKR